MIQQDVLKALCETGALIEGHFLLTSSRRHTGRLVQMAHLFEHPNKTRRVMEVLSDHFRGERVDLVLGPAVGGILPAYELAAQLGVRTIYCERENGRMKLRRGFEIQPGMRVLIAEDVITTGGSLREVLGLIRALGGEPVGIAAIANLSASTLDFGVPLYCAAELATVSYDQQECPYCKQGIALIRPASRSI